MNENLKSIVFVAVAAVALLVAWAVRPSAGTVDATAAQKNKALFPEFTDPRAATSLEILQFDESTGTPKPFKVALHKDRWSIPSHNNYPADAKDHMAEAATSMLDLTALDMASESPGDHELYGVVDPAEAKAGATGVGMKVVMKDKDDKQLLGVIVGKEVPDKKELRYLRVIGQDPTYVAKVSTDKLSTKFEEWIEKDLLKLSTWDVKNVTIDDYSIDEVQGALIPRNKMTLEYNDAGEPKWKLLEDLAVQGEKLAPQKLGADEELNAKKLDDLKFALGDLKIVDVAKKPDGLSGQLRAKGEIRANRETVQSLGSRGFHFARVGDEFALYSTEGEVHAQMKDGVKYVLRFGRIAGAGSEGPAKKDPAKKDEKDGEKSSTPGMNRYLFVMAEFDPSLLEKPKLETVPPEPKPEAKPEAKPGEAKKDAAKKEEPKKDESKPDPKAERKRIEDENKKKQEEYDKKIADGKKRVEELNTRFADWYYVISDDVYQKIHLGRKEVVQKKEKKEEGKKDEAKSATDSPAEFKDLSKDVPAAKPGAETEKKPDAPAPKPESPEKKPDAAAPKPDAAKPAEKPAAPAEKKPEPAPEKKPEPGAKPEAAKPAAPAEKKPEPPAPAKK